MPPAIHLKRGKNSLNYSRKSGKVLKAWQKTCAIMAKGIRDEAESDGHLYPKIKITQEILNEREDCESLG
jgi:hypothetical protein